MNLLKRNGVGIGLRLVHAQQILFSLPKLDWLEIHPENFLTPPRRALLHKINQHYPLSFHGVGLSLASPQLDPDYLKILVEMVKEFDPIFVSDHLSWNAFGGLYYNDLFPIPYTETSLDHLCAQVDKAQSALGRHLLVENPSRYMGFQETTFSEGDFMIKLADRTGCHILLDLNNLYVTAHNNQERASTLLSSFQNSPHIKEVHLAGHSRHALGDSSFLIDDHGSCVAEDVWALYEQLLKGTGPLPTLIEWDTHLPPLSVLMDEARKAQTFSQQCIALHVSTH